MLSVDIKVNGATVVTMAAINREGGETCLYEYQIASFPINFGKPRVFHGKVAHLRADGIEELVRKFCEIASTKVR